MDSTRCVLATIKIVQLGMGIFCLALRESAHMNPDLPEVHNTLFCGTFMGFTIIAVALLLGYCIRKPAPKEVDLFFGFVGGVCFYVCGTLSMYYPTIDEKMSILPPEEKAKYPFFQLCTNIALACFATALLYIFETCVLYDIWSYERRRRKRRKLTKQLTPAVADDDIDDEEDLPEGQLGRLRLNAYCLSTAWTQMRASCTSQQPATPTRTRASEALSTESLTQQPQPGPSSASDHQRQRSSAGLETRIRITPPQDDDEEDMNAKD